MGRAIAVQDYKIPLVAAAHHLRRRTEIALLDMNA
jgi:hypothetical protein